MIRRTGFLSALALLVWMASVYAATPLETTLLPTSTYAPDTYVLPIIDVPAGYTIAMIKVDREEWLDTNTSIVASLEVSTDGFVTSTALGSASFPGGLYYRRGVLVLFSAMSAPIPYPESETRQLRWTVTMSGGNIPTTVIGEIR